MLVASAWTSDRISERITAASNGVQPRCSKPIVLHDQERKRGPGRFRRPPLVIVSRTQHTGCMRCRLVLLVTGAVVLSFQAAAKPNPTASSARATSSSRVESQHARDARAPSPGAQAGARAHESHGSSPELVQEQAEEKRRRDENRERQEAQYARNIYAVQVAMDREIVKTTEEIRGYSGRVEFAMLFPVEDGASLLRVVQIGVSGWGSGQENRYGKAAWGFGIPVSIGLGYRTPSLIGYAGLTFGGGKDTGAQAAAGAYGGFANLGWDLMGFRLLADMRAEYRIMKAGKSRWHLTYGGLASVDL